MKMILMSLLVLAIFAGSAGHASTRVGNGGGVLVCTDPQTKAQTVTLLDLYEGRKRYGLTIPTSPIGHDQQIELIWRKIEASNVRLGPLNDSVGYEIMLASILVNFEANLHFIDPQDQLQLIYDANYLVIPKNCERQQLAIVTNAQFIVDPILYQQMDETSKAAFFVHEAIYYLLLDYNKMNTDFDDLSSDSVRKGVAYLFSNTALEPILSPEASQGLYCESKSDTSHQFHRFYIFPRNGKVVVEFTRIFGEVILSKTSIEMDPNSLWTDIPGFAVGNGNPESVMLAPFSPYESPPREDSISVNIAFDKSANTKDANELYRGIQGIFVASSVLGVDASYPRDITSVNCVPAKSSPPADPKSAAQKP